jgi:hypothetical protein
MGLVNRKKHTILYLLYIASHYAKNYMVNRKFKGLFLPKLNTQLGNIPRANSTSKIFS